LGLVVPDLTGAEPDWTQILLDAFADAVGLWQMASFPFGEMTDATG
jgi:hypothetical protein